MRVLSWLATLIAVLFLRYSHGDGNVGCLFDADLCIKLVETCYDDLAFGRCLQETVEADDLYRFEFLGDGQLDEIKAELESLLAQDYHWEHPYTQCRIQTMLYGLKSGIDMDLTGCGRFIVEEEDQGLDPMESLEPIDEPVAIVRFTPSLTDPHASYADEVYYPPSEYTMPDREFLDPGEVPVINEFAPGRDEEEPDYNIMLLPNIVKKSIRKYEDATFVPAMHRRADINSISLNLHALQTNDISPPDTPNDYPSENPSAYYDPNPDAYPDSNYLPYVPEPMSDGIAGDFASELPILQFLNELQLSATDIEHLLKRENLAELQKVLSKHFTNYYPGDRRVDDEDDEDEEAVAAYRDRIEKIRADMNAPRYSVVGVDEDDTPEPRIYYDDLEFIQANEETGSGEKVLPPLLGSFGDVSENAIQNIERRLDSQGKSFGELRMKTAEGEEKVPASQAGIYTEGGVVFVPETRVQGDNKVVGINWGFKRHERLDVKKPGPPFDTKTPSPIEVKPVHPKIKKTVLYSTDREAYDHAVPPYKYDVDSDFAYVDFKEGIRTWKEGREIVLALQDFLNLPEGTFTNPRVQRHQITFKVEENGVMNATTVAVQIDKIKNYIEQQIGVVVTSTGIGYATKIPIVGNSDSWMYPDKQNFFLSKLLIGCMLGAVIMACVTLSLVYKHSTSRQKLQDLTENTTDTEASKDYQELCRSRMATKSAASTAATTAVPGNEKTEGVHGRITSLSRESDQQSPSSRSSTSSWSEEPVLSNMDISTGHMVLSYMEDHLKNKDRLEQEWVALCAYEAEPCATVVAQKTENLEKNRYPHVLPYDHARVVLSSLANITESDYINASTITDHDPRNPAYIASQGPLPHTAPDFWQMVWEQGSVVMVMLTRLTENGNAMCHRYWPEEGSELYHIYEVHLVSEHIWCDDYLVRSFYLKNMKTGETRTVTQFHFLSWPELGVPTSTKALLEFRRKVNKSYRGRSCPIIVHCSDGAGRTGTYCLIDMVLNRMSKGAKEIDIAATLEHIRDQRPAMVTTKQQFEFVLMAVAEEVHAILKALPATIEKQ